MSDTPRTDAQSDWANADGGERFRAVDAEFARELERENSKLRELIQSGAIVGELTRAGTMRIGDEEVTGLVISMTIDELREIKRLPIYRRVSVSEVMP